MVRQRGRRYKSKPKIKPNMARPSLERIGSARPWKTARKTYTQHTKSSASVEAVLKNVSWLPVSLPATHRPRLHRILSRCKLPTRNVPSIADQATLRSHGAHPQAQRRYNNNKKTQHKNLCLPFCPRFGPKHALDGGGGGVGRKCTRENGRQASILSFPTPPSGSLRK